MKTRMFITTALAVTAVLVSVASAGAPMGAPTALLGEGNWGLGGEYGFEQIDLDASGTVTEQFATTVDVHPQAFQIADLRSSMFFGTLAYGLSDDWDIFARLGAADAGDDIVVMPSLVQPPERRGAFDGGYGFAWGAGTRATFWRSGPWSFGGLAQFTWFRPGDSAFTVADPLQPDESWVGNVELDYWQVQASLAATYQADMWRLWIGPFVHIIRGDMDFDGNAVFAEGGPTTRSLTWTSSLEEASQIGGHFGAHVEFADEWSLWVEGQVTGDSWLVGTGLTFVPGKTFGM
jgi:hypothetical protein